MIDLSTWNLTIPTEPTPQVITTQQLNNGYQSRYFQQGNDGGLVFWVPIDGSHTEDSTYPAPNCAKPRPTAASTTGTTGRPTTNCG